MNNNQGLGLYFHIPFCRHRCSYCDFNTYTSVADLQLAYGVSLCHEIEQVAGGKRRPARTLFFGGGTPSLMSTEALGDILKSVSTNFDLADDAEITLEANPDTVDELFLRTIRQLGVNRLSFGAQSAIQSELELLEREHSFDTVAQAVELSRSSGFDNINLDLIYGLPKQSLSDWAHSLRSALSLGPDHLSLYALSIETGTPMHRWLKNGLIETPDPDLAAEQYEFASNLLLDHGFEHYEISNWTKPGQECKHNLIYWRNQQYLGFGAGAHGHAAGYRYSVVKQPRVYIRRMRENKSGRYPWSSAVAQRDRLTDRMAKSDTVIMQLRLLNEGLDLEAFELDFGQSLYVAYPGTVEQLIDLELLVKNNNRLLLTKSGRFLSNQVFYRFV